MAEARLLASRSEYISDTVQRGSSASQRATAHAIAPSASSAPRIASASAPADRRLLFALPLPTASTAVELVWVLPAVPVAGVVVTGTVVAGTVVAGAGVAGAVVAGVVVAGVVEPVVEPGATVPGWAPPAALGVMLDGVVPDGVVFAGTVVVCTVAGTLIPSSS